MLFKAMVKPEAEEPLSLEGAKAFLRIPEGVETDDLQLMISAARNYAENVTGRAFVETVVTLDVDAFADRISLPIPDCTSVQSVKWYDELDGEHTVSANDYIVRDEYIRFKPGKTPTPNAMREYDPVRIVYTCKAPAFEQVQQAMLMLISHWYDNRTSVIIGTTSAKVQLATDSLLKAYKVWWY